MPMRRHSRVNVLVEPATEVSGASPAPPAPVGPAPAATRAVPPNAVLPPELEARIRELETCAATGEPPSDFDSFSWFWMILLGVLVPVLLLVVGWFA